jgi:hypothetical protein
MLAWLSGIRLDQLLLDNVAAVKDLDSSLGGTQLLLCNPKQGALFAHAITSLHEASTQPL